MSPTRPARGTAHLWVPRGKGNHVLLLALVLDRAAGHPDNMAAIARTFDVDPETARRWRHELLKQGLCAQAGGYLVATDKARELLRAGCDPLPRVLLRRGVRPTPAELRACAVVYADAIGWRADRRGCRADAERAALAGTSRRLVIAARRLLAERALVTVEALRRGRADLRRVRLEDRRRSTHGAPLSDRVAARIAAAAERGRRGAVPRHTEGCRNSEQTHVVPKGDLVPIQAPAAPARMVHELELGLNGCQHQQLTAKPQRRARAGATPTPIAAVLDDLPLKAEEPAQVAESAAERERRVARRVAEFATDRVAMLGLLQLPPLAAGEQLLALVEAYDQAPKRRRGAAVQLLRLLGVGGLLALIVDVTLSRPRCIAAALLARTNRIARGEPLADVVSRHRRAWPLERAADELARRVARADGAPAARPARQAPDRSCDPRVAGAEAAVIEHAQRGAWRQVDDLMRRYGLELGWDVRWLSDRAGIAEGLITAELEAARAGAASEFAARIAGARRTA